VKSWIGGGLAWGGLALGLGAQTPLDCTPPRLAEFTPPVFIHDELPSTGTGAPPVAIVLDAEGRPIGSRLSHEGDPLPPDDDPTARWIAARNTEGAVPGACWSYQPTGFHFALDENAVQPPVPRLRIRRVPAAKFVLVSRVIEKGLLRAEVRIDTEGNLTAVEVWDQRLTRYARDFLKACAPTEGPFFAPARDRRTGEPVAVVGEFRWDLGTDLPTGVHWDTDLVAWEDLEGPAADFTLIVSADGEGGVRDAFLADGSLADHPDMHHALLTALALPLVADEAGETERWVLRSSPTDGTLRKHSALPVELIAPVMLYAPRPEYPKRLWRRGPEGYVYVRFEITAEGHVDGIAILESTEDEFATAAREALQSWRFEPMTFGDEAIRSEVIMTLPFRLPPRRY